MCAVRDQPTLQAQLQDMATAIQHKLRANRALLPPGTLEADDESEGGFAWYLSPLLLGTSSSGGYGPGTAGIGAGAGGAYALDMQTSSLAAAVAAAETAEAVAANGQGAGEQGTAKDTRVMRLSTSALSYTLWEGEGGQASGGSQGKDSGAELTFSNMPSRLACLLARMNRQSIRPQLPARYGRW